MPYLLLAACLALAAVPTARALDAPSIEEDRAWIERYLQQHPQTRPDPQSNFGKPIAFGDLPQYMGQPVNFTLASGQRRTGTVERMEGGAAIIRVALQGGHFEFRLERAQVRRLEVE